nr:MAG TPA: hypothetical protein [Bacteriophage sp.]
MRYFITLIAIQTRSLLYINSLSILFLFQQEENPLSFRICLHKFI